MFQIRPLDGIILLVQTVLLNMNL